MNKVILIGRLTKDPEIRTTTTGKKVASFSVATSEGKDSSGQELTQFFNCSGWDKLADIIESYVKKGSRVAIVGSLKNRSWDGSDGTKRYATDISVRELEILTTRAESEAMQQASSDTSNSGNYPAQQSSNNSKPANKPAPSKPANNDLPEIDINDLDDMNVQMPF
jgi:single-strand DNA-binding protein